MLGEIPLWDIKICYEAIVTKTVCCLCKNRQMAQWRILRVYKETLYDHLTNKGDTKM